MKRTPIRSDLRVSLETIRIPKTVEDRYLLFLSIFGGPTTYWKPADVAVVIGIPVDDSNFRRMQRSLMKEGRIRRGDSGMKPERGGNPLPAYYIAPATERPGALLEPEALAVLERRKALGSARWTNAADLKSPPPLPAIWSTP